MTAYFSVKTAVLLNLCTSHSYLVIFGIFVAKNHCIKFFVAHNAVEVLLLSVGCAFCSYLCRSLRIFSAIRVS